MIRVLDSFKLWLVSLVVMALVFTNLYFLNYQLSYQVKQRELRFKEVNERILDGEVARERRYNEIMKALEGLKK